MKYNRETEMEQLKEYRYLIATIFAVFAILLIGAVFSETFTQQRTYLELFMLFGGMLFVFSVLTVVVILGFSSFALFLAFFLAAAIAMYGIEAALLTIAITYCVWGFAFSIELLLADNDVPSAIEWFESRYTFESFKREYFAFYPMIFFVYLLIEVVPNILHRETLKRFSPSEVFEKMRNLLR